MLIARCNYIVVVVVCKCSVRPRALIARKIDVKILGLCLFRLRMKRVIARYCPPGLLVVCTADGVAANVERNTDIRSLFLFL
jgi:hypothetical protein